MNTTGDHPDGKIEESLRAELATATFRVAKRHRFQAALIDIELDVWDLARQKQVGSLTSRTQEILTVLRPGTAS
jgi:hypothetical protein